MKELLFKISYFFRIHVIVRKLFQRNKVTILLFHELPMTNAEDVIGYLNANYNVISLDEYILHRTENKPTPLPEYPLVITFDDGRKSNMELTEIFARYGNKPTVYVCADRDQLDGYDLFNETDFTLAKNYYDLQSHTLTHPNLIKTPDDKAEEEIMTCKSRLEEKLKIPMSSFAYPYGWYTDRDVKIAEASGYTNAVTVDFGFNDSNTPLYKLKRICISDEPTVAETAIKTCGLWGFFKGRLNGYAT